LKTPHFRSSKILTNFLRFIVTETLEGNEQYLKEYVIGTEVLKKGPDFNPQLDAIVRIHARRLRKLMEEYYSSQGIHDPVKISIPTGRYTPVFEKNDAYLALSEPSSSKERPHQEQPPKVAIVPLTKIGNNERLDVICTSLCRDLGIELSKYQELSVISNYSVQMAQSNGDGIDGIIGRLKPDYLLMATCIVLGDDFSSTIELHAVRKDQLIWGDTYKISDYEHNALKNYQNIIKKVVSNISGFLGIIYQDLLSDNSIPNVYDYMYAIYWHNKLHENFSMEAFAEISKAIQKGLVKNPNNSLLNSINAELLLNQRTMQVDFEIDPLNEGMNYAMKAISLDQNNQHAHEMLSWAFILKHNKAKSKEAIQKCLSINPNNTMYHSTLGFGYVCIGEYEKGWQLLSDSVRSTYYFWVTNIGLCLYHLKYRNYEEAYYWARLIKRPKFLWDALLRSCCAGHLMKEEEFAESNREIFQTTPDFNSKASEFVSVFILDQELNEIIIEGLTKANVFASD
jgi:TolB-like protein